MRCRLALALAVSFGLPIRCGVFRGRVADLLVRAIKRAHAHKRVAACTCTYALLGSYWTFSQESSTQANPSLQSYPYCFMNCDWLSYTWMTERPQARKAAKHLTGGVCAPQ